MIYLYSVIIISLVIFVHELGHLIAARMVSLPVKTFSIDFGPRLTGFVKNGIDYRLSLILLGGYIEPIITSEEELLSIPLYRRIIFTLGGVSANIIFAILVLCIYRICSQDMSFLSALHLAMESSFSLIMRIFASLPTLFKAGSELSGIIGIVHQGGSFIATNYWQMFNFAGILSLNLAVINLLPLPVLDGGKVLLYVVEKIVPPIRKISFALSIASWIVILGLTVMATANDIVKLIT